VLFEPPDLLILNFSSNHGNDFDFFAFERVGVWGLVDSDSLSSLGSFSTGGTIFSSFSSGKSLRLFRDMSLFASSIIFWAVF